MERPKSERAARRRTTAIWLLVVATAATAVALYLTFVPSLEPYTTGSHVPWWALAAGFAATEVFVIHAHVRGSALTLSLSEIPLVIGLLLGLPKTRCLADDRVIGGARVGLLDRGEQLGRHLVRGPELKVSCRLV